MSLTHADVQWVAHLARLKMADGEVAGMAQQLAAVLDYVRQLEELDTAAVEPLAHPVEITNVFRGDEPAPSLPVQTALANAPDRQDDFFGVPAVLD